MANRLDLHSLLETVLGSDEVYFQPPESIRLVYPCIIYKRSSIRTDFANNLPYSLRSEYTITLIEPDPDSPKPYLVANLETARHERFYTADNLNHNVFTLFF